MPLLGLIGYPLEHSFSKHYFKKKFDAEGLIGYDYREFPLDNLALFPGLVRSQPGLIGLNVTIPYKISILPFLDTLDDTARAISAVNTVKISRSGNDLRLAGYNTDAYGFLSMFRTLHQPWHQQALILGTGGAARAVRHVFNNLGIDCLFVSRCPSGKDQISYSGLDEKRIKKTDILVNATPLGMFPHVLESPDFHYDWIRTGQLVIDLIYNPPKTVFLQRAEEKGAVICNGLEMFHQQAESAWEIWKEE